MASVNDNKIDLSSVNKKSTKLKLPKISNPFKRQVGPARDNAGKFTSGSGGLLQSKKLNLKRTLPVVAVVALVGGFFVFQSFAGTKKPNYQYSAFSCSEIDTKSKNQDYSCQDYSAESGVYRAYKAVLGRYPPASDYKGWVQPMVGGDAKSESVPGRLMYQDVVKRILGTSEAKTSSKGALYGSPNDGQLVANIFKNALDRQATNTDIFGWVKLKADKKWSNDELVFQIISTKEVREKQRPSFVSGIQSKQIQKSSVADYAARRVTNRLYLANLRNQSNKSTLETTKQKNADNRARLASSQAIARKADSTISKGEYESIKNDNADIIKARASGFRGSEYMGVVNKRLAQITELNETTKKVKSQSPDLIKDDKMQREYNFAVYVRDQMNREIEHADWLYSEAMRAYDLAKKKYDNHQAYVALQAAIRTCQNAGNIWQNGKCVSRPQQSGGGNSGSGGSSSDGSGNSGGSGDGPNSSGSGSSGGRPCPASGGPWAFVSSSQRCYDTSTKTRPYCKPGYTRTPDQDRCVKNNSIYYATCSAGKIRLNGETKYWCMKYQAAIR